MGMTMSLPDLAASSMNAISSCHGGNAYLIFLYFGPFFKKNLEINSTKTYFQDLALLSHTSMVGVTHEGVMPCVLA
jgi:hypothetical protein